MRAVIAIDAGGTSTRAVLVDQHGRRLGSGRAAGGNPTSAGPAEAVAAVISAIEQALRPAGTDPGAVETVLVAHAGGHDDYQPGIERGLAALGVRAPVQRAGDVAALFASGTHERRGTALIAGTGAIGGVIRDGGIARTVDGTGWLLGDAGSGFWIGHLVARAVVDDLDGGPSTALTPALLDALGLGPVAPADGAGVLDGRPAVLGALLRRLYALRPVQLSRFAPLAFGLAGRDPLADEVLHGAVAALAALLGRLRRIEGEGPLVVGGSVLVEGVLPLGPAFTAPLLEAAGDAVPVPVADGLVGAAVLALRSQGVEVGERLFAVLAAEVRGAEQPR